MAIGPLKIRWNHTYIIFCADAARDLVYLKIGHSHQPIERFNGIKTSCPLPASEMWMAMENANKQAVALERSLHRRFANWNTQGEWFCFNMRSPDDKASFSIGWKLSLAEEMPHLINSGWQKVDLIELQRQQDAMSRVVRPMYARRAEYLRRLGVKC
jgi:hypothetical protein